MKSELMMPAGEYYIGDPCYVIDNDLWDEFCDATFAMKKDYGVFEFKGYKCFVSSTNYGDGTYTDQMHRKYPVDAGIIGAIPIGLVKKDFKNLGHTFKSEYEFGVSADEGRWLEEKNIYIGSVVITT